MPFIAETKQDDKNKTRQEKKDRILKAGQGGKCTTGQETHNSVSCQMKQFVRAG